MPKATTADGVELYYETRGNPDAPNKIIFVMGLSGSHRNWDSQSPYFSSLPDYQILIFDNRGAGFSHSPAAAYTTETLAGDAIFLASEVGFQKFHLVGVSMGGMISQHIALMVPERVLSVTLFVTRVSGGFFNNLPTVSGIIQFYKLQFAKDLEGQIRAAADLLFPLAYLESPAGNGSGKTNREVLREILIQRNKEVPVQGDVGKQNQLNAVKAHGLTPAQMATLKAAKFSILALVGDEDILIKPSHSYAMPDQIGADLIIVEGAGHGIIGQNPDLMNHFIQDHCERAASGIARNNPPKTTKIHYTEKPPKAITPHSEELKQQATAVEGMENVAHVH